MTLLGDLLLFAFLLLWLVAAAGVMFMAYRIFRKTEKSDRFNDLQKTLMYLGIALVTAVLLFGILKLAPISFPSGSSIEKGPPPSAR